VLQGGSVAELPDDQSVARPADITLYFAPASRAFTPRWLLEELELPYNVKSIDLRRGIQKSAKFRSINPMGKVPALRDGKVKVAENPAICIYLADRYSYGDLAPALDHPLRGDYLRWMVFSTAVFEPAIYVDLDSAEGASGRGWGDRATVIEVLDDALSQGNWLLGDRFSAADVMLGSLLSVALFNNRVAAPSPALVAYAKRLGERPAFKRAAAATWPTNSKQ
jgi:glutathione S-transferase